ncbi:5-dehydro-4-deoxy-D-glucuronate isomerase [Colwellia psychrerythraea]|uniref:4-deoxy-L-threo-5-hexosulose-uronate ketol-isomerase n=1 Tax=Colwellia psychrerythraea TaxID=28229 RepID=A0A099KC35_COLPS|nr:5-dehydro-4-deoxy-D-glucuronate isomerase [Colwellia psychrerythraea]KGJ88294.1 4-deoxy-L-threo-5-hexosulose-uronate ketol-isomerase [Colwellia psychrerythraea]
MSIDYENRYAIGQNEAKNFDTKQLRENFLSEDLFQQDKIKLVYTHYERYIVGGVVPINAALELSAIDPLKAKNFLDRRELGIINIGEQGIVSVDGEEFVLNNKEALYVGAGNKTVIFSSANKNSPARFYLNSAPAHKSYPNKKVTREDANVLELGSLETSNERSIYQLIINGVVETCQLQMGMTCLKPGSVWNTMPAHQHDRRMEAYLYFDLAEDQAVSHFMGEPKETRVMWVGNEQAMISPAWSIHSGAGTSNYSFIWGMAGENLDYDDMDKYMPNELR